MSNITRVSRQNFSLVASAEHAPDLSIITAVEALSTLRHFRLIEGDAQWLGSTAQLELIKGGLDPIDEEII